MAPRIIGPGENPAKWKIVTQGSWGCCCTWHAVSTKNMFYRAHGKEFIIDGAVLQSRLRGISLKHMESINGEKQRDALILACMRGHPLAICW